MAQKNWLRELRAQREDVLALAARHRAGNVRLFGSVLRGEERPGSDVDWLLDFADDASLFDLLALQEELEHLTGHPADIVTPQGLSPLLRPLILASAQAL